jgi:hypothetical protein
VEPDREPPAAGVEAGRARFRRARARVATGVVAAAAALAGFLGLLVAPGRPADLRVAGVSLAWWLAAGLQAGALLALGLTARGRPGS